MALAKTCIYYLTFACNDTCEFCNIWNDKECQGFKEAPLEKHIENLALAKKSGATTLNVTGGEPLLYEKLPAFLEAAKKLDFYITLITNGILYKDRAKELTGLIDKTFFSLDYPLKEDHNRSRGIDCFTNVISSIQLAKDNGEHPAIYFVITRDSVRFLPEMLELAQKLGVIAHVHPVYDFQGMTGFEARTYDHIKYYFKRPNVRINLAELEFLKNHGNKTLFPRCRASQTTITFLPDAELASPCFFNRGGKQGKENICYGCARTPYMLPSFRLGLDKYRLLDWYSNWFSSRKEKIV